MQLEIHAMANLALLQQKVDEQFLKVTWFEGDMTLAFDRSNFRSKNFAFKKSRHEFKMDRTVNTTFNLGKFEEKERYPILILLAPLLN